MLDLKILEKDMTAPKVAQKFNMEDAIEMMLEAFDKVTQSTIVNCFRKAGFVMRRSIDSKVDETRIEILEEEFISTISSEFLEIDCDLQTREGNEFELENFIKSKISKPEAENDEEEEEEEEEETIIIDYDKTLKMLYYIEKNAIQQGRFDLAKIHRHLYGEYKTLKQANSKQTSILDYLQPK